MPPSMRSHPSSHRCCALQLLNMSRVVCERLPLGARDSIVAACCVTGLFHNSKSGGVWNDASSLAASFVARRRCCLKSEKSYLRVKVEVLSVITSVLSERRTQFANERRSEVKYQTLSIASVATNQLAGLLRFGSTHCYLACFIKTARRTGTTRSASSPSILQ